MVPRSRGVLATVVLLVALASTAWGVGTADAATAAWDGQWSLTRYAASKFGTSLAARQHEPDFADTYTFDTACTHGRCVATVVAGPPAANTTIPRPPHYTWNGTSWVEHFAWQWDCYMGPGVPKVYAPAHSDAFYTPMPDGTKRGIWTTTIDSGPCRGTVTMAVMATRVGGGGGFGTGSLAG
ncbi:hypothetical protein ACLQ3C_19690 [Gordonia sp. DT30]|uniref:hypothetical protein n=1 Tax=unclassified Gordonia (in: high G+C Gram-positive bacteria) TaxID=2657482 RepID=UPI003CFB18BC